MVNTEYQKGMNFMLRRKSGNTMVSKLATLLTVLCLMSGLMCLPASAAASTKMITLTTNTDINPFVRVGLHKRIFGSGGPFTIRCEVNVSQFQKTAVDGNVFYNIVDGRDSSQMTVWMNHFSKKTDGWVEMKDYNGKYITFNNIDKVMISGVFEQFGLFQMGTYKAKAVVSFRNFRILNAAGKVVYSWDTDPGFNDLANLKDFEGDTMFALTFGDGSANFDITDSADGTAATTTTTTNDYYVTTKGNTTTSSRSDTAVTTSSLTDTSGTEATETTDSTLTGDTTATTGNTVTTTTAKATGGTGGQGGSGLLIGLIIAGVLVAGGGAAFLILWKTNRLPWLNK